MPVVEWYSDVEIRFIDIIIGIHGMCFDVSRVVMAAIMEILSHDCCSVLASPTHCKFESTVLLPEGPSDC